jgi:hypothetical protein
MNYCSKHTVVQLLGVREWRRTENRDEWTDALREAKAQEGL